MKRHAISGALFRWRKKKQMAKKEEKTEAELVKEIMETAHWIDTMETYCSNHDMPVDSPNRLADRAALASLRDELAEKRNAE